MNLKRTENKRFIQFLGFYFIQIIENNKNDNYKKEKMKANLSQKNDMLESYET